MCRVLHVPRSGFYHYQKQQALPGHNGAREELLEWVKKIAASSNHTYGGRRMKKALNALGYPVGRNKAKRLMNEAGVFVRYRKKYKVTTNSKHKHAVYKNLLNRQFHTSHPDKAYVSDITYIGTQEGWLYLAVVMDLYSRKIVGWSMSSRMKASLVTDALKMALWQRRPTPGLIVHSDRGIQYASKAYRSLLSLHGCLGSMSRKGDCWDNAVAESFFGRLKQERVQWMSYQSRYQAQQDILSYITMFYNSYRLHSSIGYKTPNQIEDEYKITFKNVA
jgi:putative transposase